MFDIPQIECFKNNIRETSSMLALRGIPVGQAFKMTFLDGIPLQVNRFVKVANVSGKLWCLRQNDALFDLVG